MMGSNRSSSVFFFIWCGDFASVAVLSLARNVAHMNNCEEDQWDLGALSGVLLNVKRSQDLNSGSSSFKKIIC